MPRYPIDSFIRAVQLQAGEISAGNYSHIQRDGTLRAFGDGICWRDELQSLIGQRLESPASDIVYNQTEGSVTFETGARYPTDFLVTNHQLNHDMIPGTNIDPHLHWWQDAAQFPNWLIEYRWQKMRQGQAKTTAWTPVAWTSNAFAYSAGVINQITDFGPISPPAGYGEVSDIVQFKLYRDVTNVSGLLSGVEVGLGDIDTINFDTHIQIDQFGSNEEYVKY